MEALVPGDSITITGSSPEAAKLLGSSAAK
jgi:hypothetical protein